MNKLLGIMAAIDRGLAFIIKPVVVFISLAVAIMLAYGIFTRAVLNAPVFGLEELVLLGAMWLYMLGAVLASRERSHLSADFIQVICKNKTVIRVMHMIATLISLFMAFMFATWSFDLLAWGVSKGQTSTVLKLPWYFSQGSLFFASVLFIFYLFRDLISDFRDVCSANQAVAEAEKQY
ncbi:TRAP transporter small permease [Oceanimonas doudoroffii]|nr:TRAP transporter small permease subunit [Oceanimonas doudoroffii]